MNGLIQSAKHLEKIRKQHKQQLLIDKKFMKLALKQANHALEKGEVPVGAIIVKDGKVIARAQNQKEGKNCAVYHAEMLAIIKASKKLGWRLDGCEMYVTLEPCAMCAGAIVSSRIKRLVFGMHEPKSGACESNLSILSQSGLNHKVEAVGGVLAKECKKTWDSFAFTREKINKK